MSDAYGDSVIANLCAFGLQGIAWGSVPDWIAGIGTAGALWFAFAGWRIARQELHEAAKDRREAAYRERRAHAQQFTCWAGGGSSSGSGDQMTYGVTVYALNNSQHTFLNVEITATARGLGGWREHSSVTWPRLTPNPNAVEEHRHVEVVHQDTGERPLVLPSWSTEAVFTDRDGIRWHYKNGELDELGEANA